MRISISRLRQVTDRILKHVEEHLDVDSVEIQREYYWDVQSPARYDYDPGGAAPNPDLRSFSDDWTVIQGLSNNPAGQEPALVQISAFLRAIGDNPGWLFKKPS